jgi:hypothetical protein
MTDLELLELAAKATGIDWFDEPAAKQGRGLHLKSGRFWNPLTDDGDALRLAVKLGLAVSVEYQVGSTSVLWGPPTGHVREDHGNNDPFAATRRAIVRAAAALGERTDG